MMVTRQLASALLILSTTISGQLAVHGEVNPLIRVTTDRRYLSLPHRFVTLNGEQRGHRVGLYFSTALEYRLNTNAAVIDVREAYAEITTDLGDFKFGKQILAWGAVDGNNPTDNVNPYDFYYLFLPGTDRKLGVVAGSAILYLGNITIDAVITPVFQPNRLPLNEPDFPIFGDGPSPADALPIMIPDRSIGNSEFGLRATLPTSFMDISVSYFSGFDRSFSPFLQTQPFPTALGYLRTQVIGYDLVTFLGDWALRVEGAYFLTEDKDADDPLVRNPYIQYVAQVDYSGSVSTWMAQYLGTYVTGIDESGVVQLSPTEFVSEEVNEKDLIPPKMGMPFAAIAQNAIMANVSLDLIDGRYTVRAQTLYDLDNAGYMFGGGVEVHLEDAFDLEIALTMFGGDDGSNLSNLTDFSHLSISLSYSF
ncbi:MAG: hypothetical protein IH971_06025 [Candidatus Marinimicrobia bacterium]|nr:hypothetical protein [Candidatus Neomarinimicrobiota bacterium]